MADNITLNAGSAGSTLATAEVTFSGDTAHVEIVGLGLMSGSAESYVMAFASAGAGAVGTGVQRITLASDDPAVVDLAAIEVLITAGNVDLAAIEVLLGTIDTDTGNMVTALQLIDNAISGAGFNITQFAGAAVPIGAGTEAAAVRVTIATDSTGVVSVDDNGSSLTVDTTGTSGLEVVQVTAADLNMTEASAADIKTAVELIDNTVAVLGTATYTETTTSGNVIGAVRNDDKATLASADNEIAPLQVDNEGALYVNVAAAENKSASGVAAGGAPGTDDMIAAVAGKKLLVTAMTLIATSITTNTIYVDNVDNDLLGNSGNGIALSLDADGDTIPGLMLPYNPAGWFKTDTVNEAVTLNTSTAQDIIWTITWIETD